MQIKAKEPAPEVFEAEPVYEEVTIGETPAPMEDTSVKERKTSNIVLVLLALFLLAFIVAMTVIFCVKGSTPDTLIQCVLGAGGLEALLLAGIKVSKVIAGGKSDVTNDSSSEGKG